MSRMANYITQQVSAINMQPTKNVKGDANGEVTTYFLSAEELEKYRAMVPPSTAKVKQTNSKIW